MILALAAALLAQAPATQPSSLPIDVIGVGNHSCGDWLKAQRDDRRMATYHAWLGGFISGMNAAGSRSYGNLNEGTDFSGMTAWVDRYCAANPLMPLSGASVELVVELLNRKRN